MTDLRRMAEENAHAVVRPRPHQPHPHIFRPPWLREAGVRLAGAGLATFVLGAAVGLIGWRGEQVAADPEPLRLWVLFGVWAGGSGTLMIAVGLVLALARRLR